MNIKQRIIFCMLLLTCNNKFLKLIKKLNSNNIQMNNKSNIKELKNMIKEILILKNIKY